jgi:LacI family transcriptional regulator
LYSQRHRLWQGTVSKVVNGLPVGEEYRIKVEAAIKKLNYQVNSYAQGLKAKKTYTVALLMPNLLDPFFAFLANCINLELQRRKYRMLLCCTDSNPDLEQEYVTMAQQNKVDGNYICSTIVQPVEDIAQMSVELLLQENMHTKPPLVCLPVTYASHNTTKDSYKL